MPYNYSHVDRKNLSWFQNDNAVASLVSISLRKGVLRGLHPFEFPMEYPISAIAGINGSGKSTILAMAACAFHNDTEDFTPPLSRRSYYTFSDFFIQSTDEIPIDGLEIGFGIRHDNWYRVEPGLGHQARKKSKGGKWNNYRERVDRNVLYFGVQRVVPHYERSVYKSYKSRFKPGTMALDTRKKIAVIASRIFGKDYNDFDSYEHSKYTLPHVSMGDVEYSGFNMGAGEISIFHMLAELFQSGTGTLLVIDEIELGLHETAQRKLIEELKKLCVELKCQIICSTHSHAVLGRLPPEARFFIEKSRSQTIMHKGISEDFACGKLGREGSHELDIFVEDDVGRAILEALFLIKVRKRVRIIPIGSHQAVLRQLTSRYLESNDKCICVLDGDQEKEKKSAVKSVIGYSEASTKIEKENISSWSSKRILYFPGNTWPERWLLDTSIAWLRQETKELPTDIVYEWGLSSRDELLEVLVRANSVGKHKEFMEIAEWVQLTANTVRSDIIRFALKADTNAGSKLLKSVKKALP